MILVTVYCNWNEIAARGKLAEFCTRKPPLANDGGGGSIGGDSDSDARTRDRFNSITPCAASSRTSHTDRIHSTTPANDGERGEESPVSSRKTTISR